MKNKSNKPTLIREKALWKKGIKYIAGVDEVGRGAFAGPLIAAAVIFPINFKPNFEINDSKLISKNKRIQICQKIKQNAICYAIGTANVSYINKFGITKANQKALYLALKNLKVKPNHILSDAFLIKKIENINQTPIIHGDRLSISIAASSIVAKVHRDNLMIRLHKKYPIYQFDKNKGYGTKFHRKTLIKKGVCKQHRTVFNLIK